MSEKSIVSDVRISMIVVFILVISTLFFNCSQTHLTASGKAESFFKKAEEYFKKEKWDKAIENYNLVVLNNPGSDIADDAQYKIGVCHMKKKEYILAIGEFEELTRRYQYSDLYDDARFKIARCYYLLSPKYYHDQTNTYKALEKLQEFIEDFPESEYRQEAEKMFTELRKKLATKLFETGKLYKKLHAWDSAVIYYNAVIEQYYDLPIADSARIEKAYCLIQQERYEDAQNLLAQLKEQNLSGKDKKRLEYVLNYYKMEVSTHN